jgi:hypothetical protein
MRVRTAPQTDIPDEELVHDTPLCPPHQFLSAWATPTDATDHEDTVPAIFCAACGDIRPLRIPGA